MGCTCTISQKEYERHNRNIVKTKPKKINIPTFKTIKPLSCSNEPEILQKYYCKECGHFEQYLANRICPMCCEPCNLTHFNNTSNFYQFGLVIQHITRVFHLKYTPFIAVSVCVKKTPVHSANTFISPSLSIIFMA